MSDSAARDYGIIVVGASGFTGTQVCLHVASHLPTNLRWAIAGRSRERLERLSEKLQKRYPDRVQPDILVVSFDDSKDLGKAVAKAQVCISCVMYPVHGDSVISACVDNYTDYLDSAAVPSLIRTWIDKYHKKAEQNGVALIHSCGVLTGAIDMLAVHANREISNKWSAKLGEYNLRIDELDTNVSGGTIRTMLEYAAQGPQARAEVEKPSALTPIPYTKTPHIISGVHQDPVLGLLSNSSPSAPQVRAVINRTWGLLGGPDGWGPNFQYHEYDVARSYFSGIMNLVRTWFILSLFDFARFAWFKNFITSLVPDNGSGPSEEDIKKVSVNMEALIAADSGDEQKDKHEGKHCHIRIRCEAGHYPFAGMIMAQAGATLLYERNLSAGIKGGCLTPGVMGTAFVDRVRSAGLTFETRMLENVKR